MIRDARSAGHGKTLGCENPAIFVGVGLPANRLAKALRARRAPAGRASALPEQRCCPLLPVSAFVGAGLPANRLAKALRARRAPTSTLKHS